MRGFPAWPLLIYVGVSVCQPCAAQEKARSADAFVETIGVCTHWNYRDTPYHTAYASVKDRLLDLGIRHVRAGFSERVGDLGRAGVRITLGVEPLGGSPAEIRDKIKAINAAAPGSIDAVEGPNEPDLFWTKPPSRSYHGQEFPAGVVAFQKDLFATLKADPATAGLTIIGPSLGKTYDPGGGSPNPFPKGSLTDAVDWGCFHPYPGGNPFSVPFPYDSIAKYYWHGNFPSGNIDEFPYAFDVYAPPFAGKPMAATETGYATDRPGGTSEAAYAKYLPRLYAEYFRKGIVRTFVYELVDEWDRINDHEANFGLIRHDLRPKPAFGVLKDLIALLGEPSVRSDFHPGALDYKMAVEAVPGYERTGFVHHLLLQKSDGFSISYSGMRLLTKTPA